MNSLQVCLYTVNVGEFIVADWTLMLSRPVNTFDMSMKVAGVVCGKCAHLALPFSRSKVVHLDMSIKALLSVVPETAEKALELLRIARA